MDRYFTVMVVPEREKGVKSFRIPRILFRGLLFFFACLTILCGVLGYDYWKILSEIYKNKHLATENRLLKEQLQQFQIKVTGLTDDIERIRIFEKKLRTITGIADEFTSKGLLSVPMREDSLSPTYQENARGILRAPASLPSSQDEDQSFNDFDDGKNKEDDGKFDALEDLYEKKIASTFGLQTGYSYTKEWSDLTQKSFSLAGDFASFDYTFNYAKDLAKTLEVQVHGLDEYLLNKESFLRSTPTLLPAKGWVTSYYGHRVNPISGRLRMHEGLDIGGKLDSPIIAPADAIVTFAGTKPGFGIVIQLDHGYGLESIYAHTNATAVKKGQRVQRGDLIAQLGNTGYSTGPHLHYEIRVNGTPVDPLYFILD